MVQLITLHVVHTWTLTSLQLMISTMPTTSSNTRPIFLQLSDGEKQNTYLDDRRLSELSHYRLTFWVFYWYFQNKGLTKATLYKDRGIQIHVQLRAKTQQPTSEHKHPSLSPHISSWCLPLFNLLADEWLFLPVNFPHTRFCSYLQWWSWFCPWPAGCSCYTCTHRPLVSAQCRWWPGPALPLGSPAEGKTKKKNVKKIEPKS